MRKEIKNKKELIELLNGDLRTEFLEELEIKYGIFGNKAETSAFGADGFDDSCVYTNNNDDFEELEEENEEAFNKAVDLAEKEYLKNNNLVEVFNGEVQCIMEVVIIIEGSKKEVEILETEAHHKIFEKAVEEVENENK